MTDEHDAAQGTDGAGEPQGEPSLVLNTHYVKDLSFENPNAPLVFAELEKGPTVDVNIDVDVNHLQARMYEVVLSLHVKAAAPDNLAFMVELEFAGLATVGAAVPEAEIDHMLVTEVPRFLFPFARAIVGNVTRDGGFPPLLINPIDFENLYRSRKAQEAQVAEAKNA